MVGKEDQAGSEDQQREYQLPDGEKIMIGNSKFKAPEILFRPECEFQTVLGHFEMFEKLKFCFQSDRKRGNGRQRSIVCVDSKVRS